jgi:biopolymer transport protein TolR
MVPLTRNRGRRLMGEINVVPYIDVMLVLLIIFMVTAPMLSAGIQVDLPQAAAEPLPPDLEPLVLSIDAAGAMYLNIGDAKAPQGADRVLEVVSAALRREPERPVLVKADRTVEYGRVVEGMSLLQQAGVQKVGFATESPSRAPRNSGNR